MMFADMPLALRRVKSLTAVPFGNLPNSRSSSRCSEAPLAGFHASANANNARMVFEPRRRMAESCPAFRQTQTESGGRRGGVEVRRQRSEVRACENMWPKSQFCSEWHLDKAQQDRVLPQSRGQSRAIRRPLLGSGAWPLGFANLPEP